MNAYPAWTIFVVLNCLSSAEMVLVRSAHKGGRGKLSDTQQQRGPMEARNDLVHPKEKHFILNETKHSPSLLK